MKKLDVLMLMVLILLSVTPCADAVDFSHQTSKSIVQIAHGDEAQESCNAMCACVCCGHSVVQTSLTSFDITISSIKINRKANIRSFKLSEILQNIWQPPKFS